MTKEGDPLKFVLAFEPNPNLKQVVEKKIVRGELIQSALSNKKDKATFNICSSDDTVSSLFNRVDMMPHITTKLTQIEVNVDCLDSYLPLIERESSKGVFIKIDAEGAEQTILEGACQMYEKLPVVFLMFEYSTAWNNGDHTLKEVFHLLDKSEFKIFRVTPLGLESLRFYTPDMDGPDYCNYFAVKGVDLGEIMENKLIHSATHNKNNFYLFP